MNLHEVSEGHARSRWRRLRASATAMVTSRKAGVVLNDPVRLGEELPVVQPLPQRGMGQACQFDERRIWLRNFVLGREHRVPLYVSAVVVARGVEEQEVSDPRGVVRAVAYVHAARLAHEECDMRTVVRMRPPRHPGRVARRKWRRRKSHLGLLLLSLGATILPGCTKEERSAERSQLAQTMSEAFRSAADGDDPVRLADITEFDCERAVVACPYTTREDVEQRLGFAWDDYPESLLTGEGEAAFIFVTGSDNLEWTLISTRRR